MSPYFLRILIFSSLLVILLPLKVTSYPVILDYSKQTENNIDAGLGTDKPVTKLSTASSFKKWFSLITDKFSSDLSPQQDTFSWRDMLPTHFGEVFEIFMAIVHKKWHHQVLVSIQQVEERLADMDNKIEKILKKRTHHFPLRKIYQSSDPIQQKNLKAVENEIYFCASK